MFAGLTVLVVLVIVFGLLWLRAEMNLRQAKGLVVSLADGYCDAEHIANQYILLRDPNHTECDALVDVVEKCHEARYEYIYGHRKNILRKEEFIKFIRAIQKMATTMAEDRNEYMHRPNPV